MAQHTAMAMTGGPAVAGPQVLHVDRWGSGDRTVVFIHGLGASSRYWRNLAGVSHGYRAVAPDLLGFGCSPKPDVSYDVEAHLAALVPVVPHAGVVVAHSTGGVLAAALAVRHPERVRKLLLLGPPVFPDVATARREVKALGPLAAVTMRGGWKGRAAELAMHTIVKPVTMLGGPFLQRDLPREVVADFWRHTWDS